MSHQFLATTCPRPNALRRSTAAVLLLAAAVLIAAGCGGSDGDKHAKSSPEAKKSSAPKLGMREDAICTVYDKEIASDDVEDLAGTLADLVENRSMIDDADDLELADDDGAGTLEPLEVYALHSLVEAAVTRHAAEDADIDVPDEDAALESFSKAAFDVDAERGAAILDAADDEVSGIEQKVLDETATTDALAEIAQEIDADDSTEALDEILDEAEDADAVDCGDDVDYFATDGFLEDGEGGELEPRTGIEALLVEASKGDTTGDSGTGKASADAVTEGRAYEAAVTPVMDDFVPLITRLASVIQKIDAGTVSVPSAAQGLRRQAGSAEALARRTRAIATADPYLKKANVELAAGFSSYADALNAVGSLDTAASEAEVNRLLTTASSHLDAMQKHFDTWDTLLANDPSGRLFPQAAASAAAVQVAAKSLSL